MLWAAERPSGPAHSRVGSPLQIKRLLVSDGEGRPARLLDPAASPQQPVASLASLRDPAAALTLTAGQHSYRVSHIERPVWAQEIGRDASGLYADLLVPVESGEAPDGAQPIVQRMRYIEAGHFRMGSPAAEAERYEDEGPQHAVTLTQGFWLADSACTQALWQAVMGDNPSHFTAENQGGAQHPVEQVSWDDVQLFLRRLEARLPAGCGANLPSEAEWEYACRAGTTTPFSFGETITPEQVNYDGRYPYAGGSKGLYRQATVPVRSLPANDWGLYEMHGNVWEWCADGRRAYAERDETDPRGAAGQGVSGRALRGGSWAATPGSSARRTATRARPTAPAR
ncbi:MAG: formylglycine-generating enzyme family protein, partial [Candidatus Accumulibacter sp.]|nr:formylglycine-generating enzyme family protein [Accumulibacter sp.]